ncbi:molybdenum cofactor guanylyltransferase MobA [Rhizobium panacihumi]|uniref:molybdenum cofactor guanylyltransferase MobA n=1 Tax=Rhizobium panacihumi TaxID=2008450 RepID=UPI003D7BB6AF
MTTNTRHSQTTTGLILAGGRSRRMGRDKTVMPFGDRSMIAHVVERLGPQVSTLAINALPGFGEHRNLPLVPDALSDHQGPLAGILAGLRHFAVQGGVTHMVSAPADGPFLPRDLVARLAAACPDQNTIAVASSEGHLHPVYALWPLSVADDLDSWLQDPDNRRIKAFLARHPMMSVPFQQEDTPAGPRDPFFNINTPEDFARAQNYLEQ